jgi:hypothetical protein
VLLSSSRTGYGRPRGAQDLVDRLGKGAKEQLASRLVERGLLERRGGMSSREVRKRAKAGQ